MAVKDAFIKLKLYFELFIKKYSYIVIYTMKFDLARDTEERLSLTEVSKKGVMEISMVKAMRSSCNKRI